jgi:hypothetical protein
MFLNVIPYYISSIFNCYLLLAHFSNVNCVLLCKWPYTFFCKHINSKSKGVPRQAEVALGVPRRLRPWIFLTTRV